MATHQTLSLGKVVMSRTDAERFMMALDASMKSATFQIAAINRKKWQVSEKAMACSPYRQQLSALGDLRKAIGTEFNLGGY